MQRQRKFFCRCCILISELFCHEYYLYSVFELLRSHHHKIAADSACDLFSLQHAPFSCAPMKIITEEKEFADTPSLDVADMVRFLDEYKGKSKSSCPNTNDWLDAFGDADDVIENAFEKAIEECEYAIW